MIKGKRPPATGEDASAEKPISFEGRSLDDIRDFPRGAKEDCGYQLYKVQIGEQPDNYRPMPRVGQGVEEIRIHDDDGIYRVIFTARFDEAVYVLHAFEKKTQRTSANDIDLAKDRLKKVLAKRQQAAIAAKKGSK
jgi:phage-related protein